MAGNSHKKKTSIMDKAITIVLIVFAAGLITVVGLTINGARSGGQKKTASEAEATATGAAVTEEPENEADLERYRCVLAEKSGDTEESEFNLTLNKRKGTYKQYLNAGTNSSVLDNGTYVKKKDGIELTNKKGVKSKLLYDGKYLVSENAIFKGNVPKGKKFNKTFTHKVNGVSSIRVVYKKNGKFSQQIVRKSGSSSSSGQKNNMTGTYVRKGKFIERKKEDGTDLMSIYIYKNKICTSYYEPVK